MALRYAVATGNWSNPATWDGGLSLPGPADTVHANGNTVTLDQSIAVVKITTNPGAPAVAGGGFTTSADGLTVAANIVAGTTICLTFSGSAPKVMTIVGNSTGGTANNAYGTLHNGTGTINLNGHTFGGTATSTNGIRNQTTGTINQTGNATGGTVNSSYGSQNLAAGTFFLNGNATGGTGSTTVGAINHAGNGKMTVTGSAIGGTLQYTAFGVLGAVPPTTGWTRIGNSVLGATGSVGHGGYVQFIAPDVATIEIKDTDLVTHTLALCVPDPITNLVVRRRNRSHPRPRTIAPRQRPAARRGRQGRR